MKEASGCPSPWQMGRGAKEDKPMKTRSGETGGNSKRLLRFVGQATQTTADVSAGESKPKGGCGKSPESGEKYPRRHPQG